jgi:hypothetical protein
MTASVWTQWLAFSLVYLGAFLSGTLPAAWLGTRLAPLAATAGLALAGVVAAPLWFAWVGMIMCVALLIVSILHVATTRDFA